MELVINAEVHNFVVLSRL